jgi:predicted ribosome quality control (RQC) complex YloA/Tae2 family protein
MPKGRFVWVPYRNFTDIILTNLINGDRFTALDLRRVVRDMQSKVVGFRIANIYDINGRTYLFKLAQPGAIDQDKLFIVVESGVRLHTTRFSRDRREVPSVFTMKVRDTLSSPFEIISQTFA